MNTTLYGAITAASLGALLGLVRQWVLLSEKKDSDSQAGIRTFALWALLGFVVAVVQAQLQAPLFYPLAFFGFVLMIVGYQFSPVMANGGFGYTTATAAIIAFLAGGLVVWHLTTLAVVVTVGAMLLLASKQSIHTWAAKLTTQDIRSIVQFAAITGIILPLVPDQGYGPFGALNPHAIWLMVVLISGVGFAGYVAMRILGDRAGLVLVGLIGGLASSTATTLAFSRKSKEAPEYADSLAFAIVLACTIMLARIWCVIAFLNWQLALVLLLPFAMLAVPGIIYGLIVLWQRPSAKHDNVQTPQLSNPLSLKIAIKFGLLYALIGFGLRMVAHYGATESIFIVSFLSGLTDMDAIAISSTQAFTQNQLVCNIAAMSIMIAALGNTLLKGFLAVSLGDRQLGKRVSWVLGATIVVGIVSLFLIP